MGTEEQKIRKQRQEQEKLKKQQEEEAKKLKEAEIKKEKSDCSIDNLLRVAKKNGWKKIMEKQPNKLKEMKELDL